MPGPQVASPCRGPRLLQLRDVHRLHSEGEKVEMCRAGGHFWLWHRRRTRAHPVCGVAGQGDGHRPLIPSLERSWEPSQEAENAFVHTKPGQKVETSAVQRFILRPSSLPLPVETQALHPAPSAALGRPPPFHHTQGEIEDRTLLRVSRPGLPTMAGPGGRRLFSLHHHPGGPESELASMAEGPLSWGAPSARPPGPCPRPSGPPAPPSRGPGAAATPAGR